jgi:hypothetical protein
MKAYIILGLAVVATILFIAAVATPFAVLSNGGFTQTISIWRYCMSGASGFTTECVAYTSDNIGIDCSSFWSLFQTARAFGILAVLACGVFAVVAAVCAFKPAFALLPTVNKALIGFGVATAIAGIIYFSIDFSLFSTKFCGPQSLSSSGFSIGASPVLAVVGWSIAVIALIMSFIGGGAPTSVSGVYNAV